MTYMLVHNKVRDFAVWKQVFDDQTRVNAQESGLGLVHLWQSVDDPNEVFFLLSVSDVDKAKESSD